MKKMSIMVPAVIASALFSAMVIAGPQSVPVDSDTSVGLNRAEAYFLAIN
jgi:hypothetical protein